MSNQTYNFPPKLKSLINQTGSNRFNFLEMMEEEKRLLNREAMKGNMKYCRAVLNRDRWDWPNNYRKQTIEHAMRLLETVK